MSILTNKKQNQPLIIPITKIGTGVHAGFPSPAMDHMEDVISLDKEFIKNPWSTFLVSVVGDSMTGAFIPPGAWLLVDRSLEPVNCKIILAVIDGQFTCKYYKQKDGKTFLIPANPSYKVIELEEFTECMLWGVVTAIIHLPDPTLCVCFD